MLDTAAHEAGHALLTVLREEITQRPVYITTILPRGRFTLLLFFREVGLHNYYSSER